MNTPKYYECHITIDPDERKHALENFLSIHGFKLAKLLMQKGEPSNLDMFMTGHSKDYNNLKGRMDAVLEELSLRKFKLRRYKIEAILLDSRTENI